MNPFDDTNGQFAVLVNDAGQLSLWPTFADVPSGWRVVMLPASHAEAVAFVERNWPDILAPATVPEATADESA